MACGGLSTFVAAKLVCVASFWVRRIILPPCVGCDTAPNLPAVASERLRYMISRLRYMISRLRYMIAGDKKEQRRTVFRVASYGGSEHNNYDTALKINTSKIAPRHQPQPIVALCPRSTTERSQHTQAFDKTKDTAGSSVVD